VLAAFLFIRRMRSDEHHVLTQKFTTVDDSSTIPMRCGGAAFRMGCRCTNHRPVFSAPRAVQGWVGAHRRKPKVLIVRCGMCPDRLDRLHALAS